MQNNSTNDTSTTGMTRVWTDGGQQLYDAERATRHGHCYATGPAAVSAAIDALTWQDLHPGTPLRLPFSPGFVINGLIRAMQFTAARRVAVNGTVDVRDDVERASSLYGLYGIEFAAAGELVRLYVVDRGVDVLVMAHDTQPVPAVTADQTTGE